MCLVHQLAIKCKSILHGGNIQEEITEADICGLHIYEFVASFFQLWRSQELDLQSLQLI